MATYPKKSRIATAITKTSQIDLSCQHLTTSNFLQFDVAKVIEMVPKQSINIKHYEFARLMPMPAPTMGRGYIENKAFFVPYRTVFPAWNDFITNTRHTYSDGSLGMVETVPYIPNDVFVQFFVNSSDVSTLLPGGSGVPFDFSYAEQVDNIVDVKNYAFTPRGKYFYNILCSLGYKIVFNSASPNNNIKHSALPLLSLIKVYSDWFFPSHYSSSDRFSSVVKWLKYDSTIDGNFADLFTYQDLYDILSIFVVSYDSDYIVSAWDNPNSPDDGNTSDFVINDINNSGAPYSPDVSVINNNNQDPFISDTDLGNQTTSRVSQFMLNALRGLTDYLKRHQIVGARALDRYLSRFGVSLSAEKLNRSMYIGGFSQEIQFGDVTATADTDGASLGSYAGKGISGGTGNYDFSTDEYGILIIISVIRPITSYYQGAERHTMHITPLDFYTPEFDNLGTQALSMREVFVPMDIRNARGASLGNGNFGIYDFSSGVFGFTPRYSEYKIARDNLTGDFICNSRNAGMDSWHLFRDLSHYLVGGRTLADFSHSVNVVSAVDRRQFDRIFYDVQDRNDKFILIHDFNITSNFPGSSLYDSYEFKDEEKAEKVSFDTGVKA